MKKMTFEEMEMVKGGLIGKCADASIWFGAIAIGNYFAAGTLSGWAVASFFYMLEECLAESLA